MLSVQVNSYNFSNKNKTKSAPCPTAESLTASLECHSLGCLSEILQRPERWSANWIAVLYLLLVAKRETPLLHGTSQNSP